MAIDVEGTGHRSYLLSTSLAPWLADSNGKSNWPAEAAANVRDELRVAVGDRRLKAT